MFGRFVGVILWTLAITAAAAVQTPVQSEGKVVNSLLTKNDYNLMRQHRQSTVSTYYSATTPTIVIEAPDSFPQPLRSDFSARANTALETVKASAQQFQ